jgi:nucleoside-diphosphate-sugar epimerase
MRVLVIGGSGRVGRLVLPHLAARHAITVFDRNPPETPGVAHIAGDVCQYDDVAAACEGQEAVLYMAMNTEWPQSKDPGAWRRTHIDGFDVNIKGVYIALRAAHEAAGIKQAVYTSSMSVYQSIEGSRERRYFIDEDLPTDARTPYGFTKRLGEEVCRNAAREWEMNVNVLRLCLPIADERWLDEVKAGEPTIKTAASDVAAALLSALEFRGGGFQAFMISGDYEEKIMRMAKARNLLCWTPQFRPREAAS